MYPKCNNSYAAGGVAVYVSDSWTANCVVDGVVDGSMLLGSDMLKVTCSFDSLKLVFYCFYRLHDKSKAVFVEELSSLFASECSKNVFIVGDMNLDILSLTPVAEKYLELISANGFVSCINGPTRIFNASLTCIDHIFARLDRNANLSLTSAISD